MPLYKFEVTLGGNTNVVEVECGSVKNMQAKALRMATDAISDLRDDFWERPRWTLRVTDESNMSILSLSFLAD